MSKENIEDVEGVEGLGSLFGTLAKHIREFEDNCKVIMNDDDLEDLNVKSLFLKGGRTDGDGGFTGTKTGDLVSVKKASKDKDEKTYMGIYIGESPIGMVAHHDKRDDKITVSMKKNPMIFVPETKEIIYGCQSWWRKIKSEKEFKAITNDDIENTWYVKMMKEMSDEQFKNE